MGGPIKQGYMFEVKAIRGREVKKRSIGRQAVAVGVKKKKLKEKKVRTGTLLYAARRRILEQRKKRRVLDEIHPCWREHGCRCLLLVSLSAPLLFV